MNASVHRLTPEMTALRGRIAYWQKRIELEPDARKRDQLEMFAWAELARLVITNGVRVFPGHRSTFEKTISQAFTVSRRMIESRRLKSSGSARAASGARR